MLKLTLSLLGLSVSLAVGAVEPSPVATNATPAVTAGPEIKFDQTRDDFGAIGPQLLKAEFKFTNVGNQTLEIRAVQPGCGCTVIPDFNKSVEPGKSGIIHAQLDASTYAPSHLEKSITVISNDPKHPSVVLFIAADIKRDVMLLPATVFFGSLRSDNLARTSVTVTSALPQPLVIEKVQSSVPWLTATVASSTSNSAVIKLETNPPLPDGDNTGQVTIFTKYEKYPTLSLSANLNVPPALSVVPVRLLFLKSQTNLVVEQAVIVSRNDAKQLNLTGTHVDPPALAAVLTSLITTNEPGKAYRVSVRFAPQAGAPLPDGKVELLTDDPARPKLDVPVSFR